MRRALVLVLLASLAAGGCGGGGGGATAGQPLTKAEYQTELEQIAQEVGKRIGTASSSSQKLSQEDVDRVVDAVHSFVDRVEQVTPPAAVADLHARLLRAMNDFADQFPDIARKLNEAKEASDAIAAFLGAQAVQELIRLQGELKAKGYNLELNG